MKLSIITIHCQTNFGSVLQSFALYNFLASAGYDSEIIDYRPDYIDSNLGSGIKIFIKKLLLSGKRKRAKNLYDSFIAGNIKLTPTTYRSCEELKKNPPETDLLISGSDQLWNLNYKCGHDDSYKLLFTDNLPKISYATSLNAIGMAEEDTKRLAGKISAFRSLSVRERSSAELLSRAMGRSVEWVCDPVFLLDKNTYESMCKKPEYDDYILVYLADKGELLDEAVKYMKDRLSCKVVFVGGALPKCKCDVHIKGAGPEEMLALIRHARFIITGSFHATSFSHIFHKDFMTLMLGENSERISSLVSLTGLNDQLVKNKNDFERVKCNINFSHSDVALKKFSEKSKKWLVDNINYSKAVYGKRPYSEFRSDNMTPLKAESECCGCGVCADSCPKNAISMREDRYGFLYPAADEALCINCGLCEKICALKNSSLDNKPLAVYAGVTRKTDITQSASGGIFAALANAVLEDGGSVFGASLYSTGGKLVVRHICVKDKSELHKVLGSKYVQSESTGIFPDVRAELDRKVAVLFCGTPCQCDALKRYIGIRYENLLLIDIICHGVPSGAMFSAYIQSLEKKLKGDIIDFKFRDKTRGWGGTCKFLYDKNKKTRSGFLSPSESSYYSLFEKRVIMRPSCYSCKYACENRGGDITIGDYWAVHEENPELLIENGGRLDAKKGVSAVIVNTEHGLETVRNYKGIFDLYPIEFDKVKKKNEQLSHPSAQPDIRKEILELFVDEGYEALEKQWKKRSGIRYYVRWIINRMPRRLKILSVKLIKQDNRRCDKTG